MERAGLNGLFLLCAWGPQDKEESTDKDMGEGTGSPREMRSLRVTVRETKGKHCLLHSFAWGLLIMYSVKERQTFSSKLSLGSNSSNAKY